MAERVPRAADQELQAVESVALGSFLCSESVVPLSITTCRNKYIYNSNSLGLSEHGDVAEEEVVQIHSQEHLWERTYSLVLSSAHCLH